MTLTNMKIKTRLGLGFCLVLLIMMLMVLANFTRLRNIQEFNSKIIDKDFVKLEAVNNVNLGSKANARRILELLLASDPSKRKHIEERIEANKKMVSDGLEILETLVYLPEGKILLAKIKETRVTYVASYSKVSKLVDEGKIDEATAVVTS